VHTYVPSYVGVTSEKNTLGAIVLVSGLILVWDFIESRRETDHSMGRVDLINRVILLLMSVWLIHMAESSTALVCFVLGGGIIIAMQHPMILRQARNLGLYCLIAGILGLGMYSSGAYEGLLEMLGEDPTLTGRTDTWENLVQQPINPLIGTGGYRSFWVSSFAQSTKDHYYFYINQSHNGYLETYLNNGLIGLGLLLGLIISAGIKIRKRLVLGNRFAVLQFAFFVIVVFSNWTEATFNTLNPIWFVFLLATISYSHPGVSVVNPTRTRDGLVSRSQR
jgi:O-antigen ligase